MWPPSFAADTAHEELPRRARGPVLRIALPLAALLCVAAFALWWLLLRPAATAAALPHQIETAERQRLVAQLKTPSAEDTALRALARSHQDQGRLADAVQVYEQLARRHPSDTAALLDLAVAMGMARPQGLRGAPERLLEQVLKLEPGNPPALALLGDAAFDEHDYAQAATRWRELLGHLPPNTPMAQDIQDKLQQALSLERQPAPQRP
jgi:cytochrome c-type biogenesis protein CcmH/NrfG